MIATQSLPYKFYGFSNSSSLATKIKQKNFNIAKKQSPQKLYFPFLTRIKKLFQIASLFTKKRFRSESSPNHEIFIAFIFIIIPENTCSGRR